MPSPLTIWCNAQFPDDVTAELVKGTSGHRLILEEERSANISVGGPSPSLGEADIAFGQPDPNQIISLTNIEWTHLTSAGYTRYDTLGFREALAARDSILTNSSSVFNEPCAQHLLAFMLAEGRQLPESIVHQIRDQSWSFDELRPRVKLLANQTVLILGFGAIARRLVELLAPFRLNLIAVRRTVTGDETVPTHPISALPSLLPNADHVVNILPASGQTERLIDAKVFERMKERAVFYNIGRGTTVNQEDLVRALESGHLSAAYLDVADPEPLPSGHPLWECPNCWITPHIGGGHAEEFPRLVAHFLDNLRLFEAGRPLVDRVF